MPIYKVEYEHEYKIGDKVWFIKSTSTGPELARGKIAGYGISSSTSNGIIHFTYHIKGCCICLFPHDVFRRLKNAKIALESAKWDFKRRHCDK